MSNARYSRRCLMLAVLILSALPAASVSAQLQYFQKASLTILTGNGPVKLDVEVAATPTQQEQGLMFRSQLAPNAGMIFLFSTPRVVAFWMKNTLIPLDMLFLGADDRIVSIKKRAVPLSTDAISSKAPVSAVIEINGGETGQLGIRLGDRVLLPALGNAR